VGVMQPGRCVPNPDGFCPVLLAAGRRVKCSVPPTIRPFCSVHEEAARTRHFRVKIEVKTPGVLTQKTPSASTRAGDCLGRYPERGGECSSCPRLEDCMYRTYLRGLDGLRIAAEVRVVQARLEI
jgi:hypothetical protein